MVFETGSDNEKIDKIQRQLDDVIDSQLFGLGGNDNISIDSSRGSRNNAGGDAGGVRSSQPVIHKITDVNEAGSSTGVFDKINLISSMIIVDHTSTPIDLRFIQGIAKEGVINRITVKKDKTLVIKSGGNILTTSDITITDEEVFEVVKYSEAETGVTGGAYKISKIEAGVAGAGYDTIQEEGTPLTQRSIMNFIGATVTAVDNPGNSRTDITITAGAAGLLSDLSIDVDKDWNNKKITNLGGITMNGDIDLATFDVINIDQAKFVADSVLSAGNTESIILLNNNNQFQFNTSEDDEFVFSFNNNIAFNFEHNAGDPSRKLTILSDSTDTNSQSILNLTKNFATSVSLQEIGHIAYRAPTAAGGGTVEYAAIVGKIEDATAGSIDGSLRFDATLNNSIIPFMIINDGGSGEISLRRDLNVNTHNILNIDQSRYVVDSGVVSTATDTVILLNSSAQFQFNTDQINDFVWSFSNNAALILNQDPSDNDNRFLTIQSDDTNINSASFLNITKAFSIPLDTQIIGGISFKAGTSLGSGAIEYAGITAIAQDVTSPTFDGILRLEATVNGSIEAFIDLNNSSDGKIHLFRTLDVNTNFIELTEISKPTNPVTNDGLIYVRDVAGISTPFFLDSVGTETSMIESAITSNQIIQGDSSIRITDTGPGGVINFQVDNTAVGNVTIAGGWILDGTNLTIGSPTGKIAFQNGFQIQNTNTTTTTFFIPNNENLLIKEGTATRIQIDKNITLNADTGDDLLFQEGGIIRGKYDGGIDDWTFTPGNNFIVDVNGNDDILFKESGTTTLQYDGGNDRWVLQNNKDFRLNSGSFLDFVGFGSPTVGAELGRIQIKIAGALRSIPFFAS